MVKKKTKNTEGMTTYLIAKVAEFILPPSLDQNQDHRMVALTSIIVLL
jgi:hypothetical protein